MHLHTVLERLSVYTSPFLSIAITVQGLQHCFLPSPLCLLPFLYTTVLDWLCFGLPSFYTSTLSNNFSPSFYSCTPPPTISFPVQVHFHLCQVHFYLPNYFLLPTLYTSSDFTFTPPPATFTPAQLHFHLLQQHVLLDQLQLHLIHIHFHLLQLHFHLTRFNLNDLQFYLLKHMLNYNVHYYLYNTFIKMFCFFT